VQKDGSYDRKSQLHQRLYSAAYTHPGSVYYVLVVRVALGLPLRTRGMGAQMRSIDHKSLNVFPVTPRELADVPGVTPATNHHSLIAELGGSIMRFREFVMFHGEYVHPEFLVAYQRYRGKHFVP